MIEIYLLEQLIAFEKYGTLSAASEQLHLSQPALTRSMRKLEELIGVPLFERTKNRITLNENGKVTAQYAQKILEQERDMVERVRLLDRSRRTITLGSCAPVPIADLVPVLSRCYPGMTIASEIQNWDEKLMDGLDKGRYQLIVLHEEPKEEGVYAVPYREEALSLVVPYTHPLAERSEVTLTDIDGQNMLLYTEIGFWYEMCREKLPNAHFLLMNEYDAFGEVAGTGAFPSFASNIMAGRSGNMTGKKLIPIRDPAAETAYYCVCRKEDQERYRKFYRMLEQIDWDQQEVKF